MKSYMVLIGFMSLFTCSFNVTAMGGPGAVSTDFPEVQGEEVSYLPPELEEIVIIKALDSILKDPLPTEQTELNTVLNQYLLNFLIRPQLRSQNKKYYLNKLAHKLFLTFGKHLNVPDWYLMKYFGQPGKQYTEEELKALKDFILDYRFSLVELLDHNQLNRKVINGELDLSNLRLKNLDGLLKIPNITTVTKLLILSYNQLKELPPEIGKLTNLHNIDLSHNQLKELPKEIGKLTNLRGLATNNNQLKELPQEIGKLTNLRGLFLARNQLKELPQEIGELVNLQSLGLAYNQLEELPQEIGKLTNLRGLATNNNQLEELPSEVADNLVNLKKLSLAFNPELKIKVAQIRKMLGRNVEIIF